MDGEHAPFPGFETRRVLAATRAPKSTDDPTYAWWHLLDCGCTASAPYVNPCTTTRMYCLEHPLASDPKPRVRGQEVGEAWLKGVPERPV